MGYNIVMDDLNPPTQLPGALLHSDDLEARRQAAVLLGSRRSSRKAVTSAANGRLGGKQIKLLVEVACTCNRVGVLDAAGKPVHPTTCPRGRVIRYRLTKGLPLI